MIHFLKKNISRLRLPSDHVLKSINKCYICFEGTVSITVFDGGGKKYGCNISSYSSTNATKYMATNDLKENFTLCLYYKIA